MLKVTLDFETRSRCDLKRAGSWEYSMDPSTQVTCLAFKIEGRSSVHLLDFHTMQKPWLKLSGKFQSDWLYLVENPTILFSAHNAFLEQCIYNNVLVKRLGWPSIKLSKWRCTAAKAAAVAIPRNLADAGAVMRTSTQKDYEGHRIMLKLCKPTSAWKAWFEAKRDIKAGKRIAPKKRVIAEREEPAMYCEPETHPEDFRKLYHYCKTDVIAEEQLDKSLPDLIGQEQNLWLLDQRINACGIQVDTKLVERIVSIMANENKTMGRELDMLTMGLVSSGHARNAILDFLTIEGIELPDLRAKTVDDFLKNGEASGDAKKLLEIRRALSKSSNKKYEMFQIRAKTDGRVRDHLLYHGASTGRWGGKGIQPQNFPRGIVKDIYEAIERIKVEHTATLKLLYGENLMPLFSSVLRGMFIASPGHELFVADYSAIECRVTWWLAGHEKGLDMFREGQDPYVFMAAEIFNKSPLEITDEERQVGKAAVLGCGFQMGGKKFVTSAWDVYRAKVDSKMAKVAVSIYRKVHYPVTEMWDNYQKAAILAVENPGKKYRVGKVHFFMRKEFLVIELPSGRPLSYFDPKILNEWVYPYILNGENHFTSNPEEVREALKKGATLKEKFSSKKLTYMAVNHKAKKEDCTIPKWTREKTYGGKLVENVVQAVSRDILSEAMVRAEAQGFRVLMHSHDELVSESRIGAKSLDEYRAILETVPDWAEGLPLKAPGWINPRYRKG